MTTKPQLILIVIAVLLIGGGGLSLAYWKMRGASAAPSPAPAARAPEPVNLIPESERPFVRLQPAQNGRAIEITIVNLNKPANQVEYELEYQSGTLLQGAFGDLDLTELPVTKNILLGSCSAGGKCSYHEDVTGGKILLRFLGSEKYALRTEWGFFENKEKSNLASSRDAKLQLDSIALKKQSHVVTLVSPGYPAPLPNDAKALSSLYAVGLTTPATGTVKIDLRLNEANENAIIIAWDGKSWVELPTVVSERVATVAKAPWAQAYMAIEKL